MGAMLSQPICRILFRAPMIVLFFAAVGCSSHPSQPWVGHQAAETSVGSASASQAQSEQPPAAVSPAISAKLREIAQTCRLADMQRGDFTDYKKLFTQVYETSGFTPLWLRGGTPSQQALAIIDALEHSEQKGLEPADYDAAKWFERLDRLKTA